MNDIRKGNIDQVVMKESGEQVLRIGSKIGYNYACMQIQSLKDMGFKVNITLEKSTFYPYHVVEKRKQFE